jgi:hypothetical protein
MLVAAVWAVVIHKVRRYDRIISHLQSLPAAKRRYILEREYTIYPGKEGFPLKTVRRLRGRHLTFAIALAGAGLVGFLGVSIEQFVTVRNVDWRLDDSQVTRVRYGYQWHVAIKNESSEPLTIDELSLRILNQVAHPVTDRTRPDLGPATEDGNTLVMIKPGAEIVPLQPPETRITLAPGRQRSLKLNLVTMHQPAEGWIYDVRIESSWTVDSVIGSRRRSGTTYRLGWPGLVGPKVGRDEPKPDRRPVTDIPEVLEE